MRILRPDCFFSFKQFGYRYCAPKESHFGVDWTGSSNGQELHLILAKAPTLRRL